jgi:putative FmdB family regulatory protein
VRFNDARRRLELPLYEYRCLKCKRHTEKIENVNGPHLKKCPHCGGKVEALISAPAIQFKGSGWYVTDYAKKSSGGDSSKSDKSDSGEKAEKSEKADKSESKSSSSKETKKATSSSKEK